LAFIKLLITRFANLFQNVFKPIVNWAGIYLFIYLFISSGRPRQWQYGCPPRYMITSFELQMAETVQLCKEHKYKD
jgi:hypothetical protein